MTTDADIRHRIHKAFRLRKLLTNRALSRRYGISVSTVHNIGTGRQIRITVKRWFREAEHEEASP